jgi:hypothetical protein
MGESKKDFGLTIRRHRCVGLSLSPEHLDVSGGGLPPNAVNRLVVNS